MKLSLQQKYQEALQEYEKASILCPRDPRAYAGWAMVLNDLGRLQEARRTREKTIKYAVLPQDKQILINSYYLNALLFEKENRYDEALVSLNSISTLDLEYPPALEARAHILVKKGEISGDMS